MRPRVCGNQVVVDFEWSDVRENVLVGGGSLGGG